MKLRCCGSKLGSVWCKQHLTLSMSGVGLFFNKFIYKSPFFFPWTVNCWIGDGERNGSGVVVDGNTTTRSSKCNHWVGWVGRGCLWSGSFGSIYWLERKEWIGGFSQSQSRAFQGDGLLVASILLTDRWSDRTRCENEVKSNSSTHTFLHVQKTPLAAHLARTSILPMYLSCVIIVPYNVFFSIPFNRQRRPNLRRRDWDFWVKNYRAKGGSCLLSWVRSLRSHQPPEHYFTMVSRNYPTHQSHFIPCSTNQPARQWMQTWPPTHRPQCIQCPIQKEDVAAAINKNHSSLF